MKPGQRSTLKLVLLLLLHITVTRPETFEVLGPAEPVVAVAGEDVVLPCYLRPNISAENFEVQWFRKDTTDFVYEYQKSRTITENQNPSYRGRTALFPEELKKGNVSIKLTAVRGSDGGRYNCYAQSQDWYDDWSVHVIIKGTHPVISTEGYKAGGIGLVCECKDWFPDAEVIWLDSEGQSLTAEPTETHKSVDGSVSLRRCVIVQEQSTNRFICQIHQQHLGLVTETDIEIPGEMFHRAHPWKVTFAVFFTLGFLILIILVILILRHSKLRRKKDQLQTDLEFEKDQRKAEFHSIQRRSFDVTLDPDTAHPKLILSEDGKQVRSGYTRQGLPDNPERFTWWCAVLGREGFTSGRHYWEVQVSVTGWWTLGAARESVERKEYVTRCPSEGYWSIEQHGSEYWALTDPRVSLHLRQKPQKVGVYVDYEGVQVSFYIVEDKTHIYTYSGQEFTEKLYPYFLNYSSSPLIITPFCY